MKMPGASLLRWAIAALVAAPGVARAQIGQGWTPLALTDDFIDTQSMGMHARHPIATFTTSGARYDKTGDTETFELYDPSFNRVEHDTNHHYKTGKIQFEGTVQIYPGVNHQFIVQLFNAPASGPIMALSAYSTNNGTIRKQGGSVDVATNAFGRDIRVNIIHDLDANTLTVYIDGKSAWSGGGGAGGGFNFKYGSYGSLNGSTSAKARWQRVRFWTSGGGATADAGPPRDAGADAGDERDAASPDAAVVADAEPATGGAGGGTGGKSGTGGAVGTGGKSGTGGAPGTGGEPEEGTGGAPAPAKAGGGGCQIGGRPGGGAALLILLLVLRRRFRTVRSCSGSEVHAPSVGVRVGVAVAGLLRHPDRPH